MIFVNWWVGVKEKWRNSKQMILLPPVRMKSSIVYPNDPLISKLIQEKTANHIYSMSSDLDAILGFFRFVDVSVIPKSTYQSIVEDMVEICVRWKWI